MESGIHLRDRNIRHYEDRMRKLLLVSLLIVVPAMAVSGQERAAGDRAAREADRDLLLELLLPSRPQPNERLNAFGDKNWADWLERTGELPPDFDALPSHPHL